MSFKITRSEIEGRGKFILLGFFTFYLVEPIRIWMNANIQLNDMIIGLGGILLTLWFFKF